jgi:hypothetical protein
VVARPGSSKPARTCCLEHRDELVELQQSAALAQQQKVQAGYGQKTSIDTAINEESQSAAHMWVFACCLHTLRSGMARRPGARQQGVLEPLLYAP